MKNLLICMLLKNLIKGISKEMTSDYPEAEIKNELQELVKAGFKLIISIKISCKEKKYF